MTFYVSFRRGLRRPSGDDCPASGLIKDNELSKFPSRVERVGPELLGDLLLKGRYCPCKDLRNENNMDIPLKVSGWLFTMVSVIWVLPFICEGL